MVTHFNTSHVNVNLYLNLSKARLKINFNTSHVNVNLAVAVVTPILPCNFNTSHVNVNPVIYPEFRAYPRFQYISC